MANVRLIIDSNSKSKFYEKECFIQMENVPNIKDCIDFSMKNCFDLFNVVTDEPLFTEVFCKTFIISENTIELMLSIIG